MIRVHLGGVVASRSVVVTLSADLSKWNAAMRSMTRATRLASRFRMSRPVSRERLDIAKLGRQQMAEAIAWFNDNLRDRS